MYSLTLDEAALLIRKNLDEQRLNDSDMTDTDDMDSENFENVLAKTAPEAINAVHTLAPVEILDGMVLSADELNKVAIDNDVLSFNTDEDFLRLIAFKAADSNVTIAEVYPEFSAEGRMQDNIYTRGTYDRPRLILKQGNEKVAGSSFRYYSLKDTFDDATKSVDRFEYLPRYRYSADTKSYKVADRVVQNVLDYLTGMLLTIYGSENSAAYFFNRAAFNPSQQIQTPESAQTQ